MPDLDLGALQAQLELNRSVLADSIMSKFSSLGATAPASPSSSTSNAAAAASSITPRPANLGVGATPKGKQAAHTNNGRPTSIEDAKLKGRLLAKRKRDEPVLAQQGGDDDDEEEEGRASAVGSSSKRKGGQGSKSDAHKAGSAFAAGSAKKNKNDPFAVKGAALQHHQQQLQKNSEKVVVDGKEVEMSSLSKAQRKKINKKRRIEAEAAQQSAIAGEDEERSNSAAPPSLQKGTATDAQSTSGASSSSPRALPPPPSAPSDATTSSLTPLQAQMLNRLTGSRFRTINEQLYTTDSRTALSSFTSDPTIFDEYHKGFRSQVKSWPKNPLDILCSLLVAAKKPGKAGSGGGGGGATVKPEKSKVTGQVKARYGACPLVIDLGAGEGGLAQKVTSETGGGGFRVLSFDLVDTADGWVRKADVAGINALPLPGYIDVVSDPLSLQPLPANAARGQCDVAIFCLSLMGTNWVSMILEASRCLRDGGELLIAEVSSRFSSVEAFIDVVERFGGFKLERRDERNSHFVVFEFVKLKRESEERRLTLRKGDEAKGYEELVEVGWEVLKPCLYKRR